MLIALSHVKGSALCPTLSSATNWPGLPPRSGGQNFFAKNSTYTHICMSLPEPGALRARLLLKTLLSERDDFGPQRDSDKTIGVVLPVSGPIVSRTTAQTINHSCFIAPAHVPGSESSPFLVLFKTATGRFRGKGSRKRAHRSLSTAAESRGCFELYRR